jgi:tetratricopeptide (TPR) repeat protein
MDAIVESTHEAGLKARIFISYSRKDMAFADRLELALKAQGFEPLIDRTEIYAFEDWWKRIEALIVRADTVVFVLSPDAVASDVALKEIAFAASLNKRFAPIVCRRVDDQAVPHTLARLNFISFEDEACFSESFTRLAEALDTDISWIRRHTEFGEAARRWVLAEEPTGMLFRSPVLEQAERWIASRPRGAQEPTAETASFIARSRQAAIGRRNVLTGSLVAGLLIALALAGFAYWQRGLAVAEASRAERNFGVAKSTLDDVVSDIAIGLRDAEGMRVDTMRRILGRTEAAMSQLVSRTGDNPELRASQAWMFVLFVDTYLSLGAIEPANEYAGKAVGITRQLAATNPENDSWQRYLALALQRLGDVINLRGNAKEALAAYREGLEVLRTLAMKEPGNTDRQSELALGLRKVGDALSGAKDPGGAFTVYRESLDILRTLAVREPSNARIRRDLLLSLQRIGDARLAQGDVAEGLAAYRESLEVARTLVAQDPDNTSGGATYT